MNISTFLSVMGIGTVLAWFSWAIILFQVNPDETGIAGLLMFYITLSVSFVGTLTLAGASMRIYLLKRQVAGREIRTAFRHAILFAAVAIGSLILASQGRFANVHILLLVSGACVIEYFFLQYHRG